MKAGKQHGGMCAYVSEWTTNEPISSEGGFDDRF